MDLLPLLCGSMPSFSILILLEKANSHSPFTAFIELLIICTSTNSPQHSHLQLRDLICALPAVLTSHWLLLSPSVLRQVSFWRKKMERTKKSWRILWPPVLMNVIYRKWNSICSRWCWVTKALGIRNLICGKASNFLFFRRKRIKQMTWRGEGKGKRRINLTKEECQNNPRSRKDNSFDPCLFKPTVIQSIMYKLQ